MAQFTVRSVLNAARRSWGAMALALLWSVSGSIDVCAKPPAAYPLKRSQAEERIFKALHEETNIDFVEQPLSDVLQFLQDLHKIQIQLDKQSMEDAGIANDVTVTGNIKNVALGNALTLMLEDLELDFLVTHDVLLITTTHAAVNATELRIYNINDLITADRDSQSVGEMVRMMVADDAGHNIRVSPVGDVLVIRDTQRGHGEIEVLLDTLRLALAGEPQPAAQALSAPASNAPRAPESSSASQNPADQPAGSDDGDPFQ